MNEANTAEKAKPNRKILVPYLTAAEYQRNEWVAKPEAGTSLEEMLVPAYWANVAKTMKQWDRVEVRPADGSWYAELLVRVVEPFAVLVHVLRRVEFKPTLKAKSEIDVPEGYEIKFRGKAGWCIVRNDDNTILKEKEDSKEAALVWLQAHLRALQPA